MWKLILLLIATGSQAFETSCYVDQDKDLNAQVDRCKLVALKDACEQEGISLWSHAQVNNNTLQAEQINTKSSCESLDIDVSAIINRDSVIVIQYTIAKKPEQKVKTVSSTSVTSHNSYVTSLSTSMTNGIRRDSSLVVAVNMNFAVDSREVGKKIQEWKEKSAQIAKILFDN